MQSDGPTLSNLPPYKPGGALEPGGAPTWPEPPEGTRRAFRPNQPPFGNLYTMILGVSFLANVVLLITLIAVLLAHGSLFSPRGSAPGSALASPTATANTTPTTLSGGWLQVTPSSVHLSCNGGQRTQFVVLENSGTDQVQWQVDFSGQADQSAVTVSPNQGNLRAGASVSLQVQINRHSDSSQGGSGQQGVIRFDPGTPDAGTPPSLSYTTDSCNN